MAQTIGLRLGLPGYTECPGELGANPLGASRLDAVRTNGAQFRPVYHREPTMTILAKDSRLHIRCDQEMRRLLDKAAAYARMSVSEFVLRHALERAQSVVQAHEAITLSQDDFVSFLDALDRPAQANPALQRAFARHTKHVR